MKPKHVIVAVGAYLAAGISTAAYTVYLASNGKNHFIGFGASPSPVLGMVETIVAWPYALYFNIRG